jgi:polysaccharide deacetylase 2 family uncharacterized protein YibQ
VIVVALVVLAASVWYLMRGAELRKLGPFEDRLIELATGRGVESDHITADKPIRKVDGLFVRTWRIVFPTAAARDGFLGDIEIEGSARRAHLTYPEELGGEMVGLRVTFETEAFDLQLAVAPSPPSVVTSAPTPAARPSPTMKPRPAPNARGQLAIHEIWLHLPMEPEHFPADNPGPGAIMMAMTPQEMRTAVHAALNEIPNAVGVNNHMGSKATADLRTMTWIMQELKARGMAFIDSRTTTATVAEEAARAQGVPTNRRHVFLDNERRPKAIQTQLEEAVNRCRLEGEIIAIGHMDAVTIEVLAQELPNLAKRGADLVKPSDLVH